MGSTYNVFLDKPAPSGDVGGTFNTTNVRRSICKIFSGNRSSDLYDYLGKINYNEALRQSLFFEIIQPSGVSSLLNYSKQVNENTRFLYYSYTNKVKELTLTSANVEQNRSLSYSADAIHIITEIQWGFEILCVIQISNNEAVVDLDKLLQDISKRLESSMGKFYVYSNEKSQIAQLTNVTTYGSKHELTNSSTSLDAILTELHEWRSNENHHQPLEYKMDPLRNIPVDRRFIETGDAGDEINSLIKKSQSVINDSKSIIREIEPLFNQCSSDTSNFQYEHFLNLKHQFQELEKTYVTFFQSCKETIIKLRRGTCETREINRILSDQRYSLLKTDLDTLRHKIRPHHSKIMFIQDLKSNQIQYKKLSEILPKLPNRKTWEEIYVAIQLSMTKNYPSLVLCYSSDELRQNKEKWEETYEQLKLLKQNKTNTPMIYVDFTYCGQLLPTFRIITLPEEKRPTPKNENPASK